MDTLSTALLASALFGYVLYRQSIRRPVTRGDLLLPALGGLYLGTRYLDGAAASAAALVLGAAALGLATGVASGVLVRVWREGASGVVYQHGGWRYAAVALALVIVRVALRYAARAANLPIDAAILNDAFIALLVGSFLGRALIVGGRALALVGGDLDALPDRREVRRAHRAARHADRGW